MSHQQGLGAGPGGPPYGQQPPYGRQPPYGQQPPYGWGAPPPGPRGPGRGLVVLIVVITLLVVGGLVGGGIVVLGGGDESAQADDPPTDGPSTDPTPAPSTDPTTPSPTPTASPGTPTGEQMKLEAALDRRGFRCGLSFLRPVAVRTCYHDPYLPYGDAYVQSVLDRDGGPRWVDVQVHSPGEAKRVGAVMGKALEAMRGTLLTAADIRTVRSRPNARGLRLSWGRAETYRSGPDYLSVTISRPGYEPPYVELGAIRTTATAVRRHYAGKRYRCEVDAGFRSVDCLRKAGRETYAVSALAPCVRKRRGRLVPCPGRAPSMTVFWGLDHRRVTNAMVRRVVDGVFLPGARLAMGGQPPPELRSWLLQNLDGDLHVADFDGLHFEIDPHTRFTDREAEVALSITYVSSPS